MMPAIRDGLTILLPAILDYTEGLLGSGKGSAKFALAFRITKAALMAAADTGRVSYGDAHDDLQTTREIQNAFDNSPLNHPKALRVSEESTAPAPQMNPIEAAKAIYDKTTRMPMTTPPPGLEEERGVVFVAPPKDAPLHEQTPNPDAGRVFTTPDPLMRSAPTEPVTFKPSMPGPSTNIGPGETVAEAAAKDKAGLDREGNVPAGQAEQPEKQLEAGKTNQQVFEEQKKAREAAELQKANPEGKAKQDEFSLDSVM